MNVYQIIDTCSFVAVNLCAFFYIDIAPCKWRRYTVSVSFNKLLDHIMFDQTRWNRILLFLPTLIPILFSTTHPTEFQSLNALQMCKWKKKKKIGQMSMLAICVFLVICESRTEFISKHILRLFSTRTSLTFNYFRKFH